MTFKQLLKQKGFTQEQLADELQITQVAVSKWVCGKSTPTRDNMLKIANVLNVDTMLVIKCFYN